MYESIRGVLRHKELLKAVVETHGVGYRLAIPLSAYGKLPEIGADVFLFLSHIVREDIEALYAFVDKGERDLFEVLIALSGIGPKTGLAIVGHMDPASFHHAIQSADTRILSKIPGVGKKTAERLIVEMKDKLIDKTSTSPSLGLAADATRALMNLGYNPLQAQKAVQAALKDDDQADLSHVIRLALSRL
ncbi:MAG: holliday junction ATP-dependent helicase ruvA [Chlamydiota bacterium]|jgi:Holliday junction DNA helicase RuvA